MEPFDLVAPPHGVGSFKDDGYVVETAVVHKADEEFFAEGSLAKHLVTVDMTSATFLAIV